jgi:hypothetical protein
MIVLHGYIDDSGGGNIFVLSCLQGEIGMWLSIDLGWRKMLNKVNARLRKEGRKEISRYHAADCGNLKREFKGWTRDEQIELTKEIMRIFKNGSFHVNAYSIDLKQLQEEIPETKASPKGFAYVFLLMFLMLEICDGTLRHHKDAIMGLTHDHCDYDAAMQEAFNHLLDDENFKCRDRFTSLMPERWQNCIPLQPADLFAYENYKEALRRKEMSRRKRRTTLRLLLDDQPKSLGGNLKVLNRANLRHFKKTTLAKMSKATKAKLFAIARIRTKKEKA